MAEEEYRAKVGSHLYSIMEDMMEEIMVEQPTDFLTFSIDWLRKKRGDDKIQKFASPSVPDYEKEIHSLKKQLAEAKFNAVSESVIEQSTRPTTCSTHYKTRESHDSGTLQQFGLSIDTAFHPEKLIPERGHFNIEFANPEDSSFTLLYRSQTEDNVAEIFWYPSRATYKGGVKNEE